MNYFAFWCLLGAAAIWFIGFEKRGRTIEDIDNRRAVPAVEPAKVAAGN